VVGAALHGPTNWMPFGKGIRGTAGMSRITVRRARKDRGCDGCLGTWNSSIKKGDLYLEHVCSPDHDGLGNEHWRKLTECKECATRSGRAHMLERAA
jgi:hypothetical protein